MIIIKEVMGIVKNEEEYFNAEQNAITAKDAEFYYRTMIKGDI
jgi:hypothetical protein